MRSLNVRGLPAVLVALLPPLHTFGQECRVIPLSSDPAADSITGAQIELTAGPATITAEIECRGWGGVDLKAYCFVCRPICAPFVWVESCQPPGLPEEECQTAADCVSEECINGICTPVYAIAAGADWVFESVPAITAFSSSTEEFCAAALDTPAADDGTFQYFANCLVAVEDYCPEQRIFEITLEDATFYLVDDTTQVPTVTPASVEISPVPPPPPSATGCACNTIFALIPLFSVLLLWRGRRTPLRFRAIGRG
jgi:hypothetical protein